MLPTNNGCKSRLQAQAAFQAQQSGWLSSWAARLREYEAALKKQVEELRAQHSVSCAQLAGEMERRRPERPRFSADYLNQRKIEECLAKQGMYDKAQEVKVSPRNAIFRAWHAFFCQVSPPHYMPLG